MSENLVLKNAPTCKIIGAQFCMLSPVEIEKSSVCTVTKREMYVDGKPVTNGLADIRMGVQDPGMICPTDNLDYINTPGYHGHIDLAAPVFYIQYMRDILKWSRCVCFNCSKLLISKTKHSNLLLLPPKKRWIAVVSHCRKVNLCGADIEDGCQTPQPAKIYKDGFATINANFTITTGTGQEKESKIYTVKWTPEYLLKIFRRISDDDVNFAGFNSRFSRPEWMICSKFLVPPPAIRPSVKHDSQQRSEDDLTHILLNIVSVNNELVQEFQKNSSAKVIDENLALLQYFIAIAVNNNIPSANALTNRSNRPLKSIYARMNGKTGRMRGNVMAKRVDFSARSVITGEPNLSITELGVPMPVAMHITKPVTVTSRNREFLTLLVKRGPEEYPGANILRKNGSSQPISLKHMDRTVISLDIGDVVHRHLMDGDFVLFNRQPTLHRMSMQGFSVRVMKKGNTFRFNVGVAQPFNADYDGDEMNMHMPQNSMAEMELRELAAVPYQIISPANNSPIIGPVQDNLLGAYLFTDVNVSFTPQQAMNLLMTNPNTNVEKLSEIIRTKSRVTNWDILSQITPPISLKYPTKAFDKETEDFKTSPNVLEIHNGEYKRGQMDKSVLSGGSKSLIQRITNTYGNKKCANYIDNIQNIVTSFMKMHSFSVGISDLISNKSTTEKIVKIIDDKRTEVKDIIDKLMLGTFVNNTGRTNKDEFEGQVLNILSQASGDAGKVALKSLDSKNRFVTLVKAGSKGNENNIAFMTSCLGQQTVEGKRIPDGFNGRTLPHFPKYDESPASRGFVVNSYVTGLTQSDLFFHAMAGRVGLIDTAVKSVTWETPIILIEKGVSVYTEIGRWIDDKLAHANPQSVQHFTERNMELLDTNNIYIPTTDADGNVTWGEIVAVTRHDPGDKLYEIKTQSGRSVTVTESKSLLIWDESLQQFHEKPTPEIKIGDFAPVTMNLCIPPVTQQWIHMANYLPKTEYLYGTEFNTAVKMINESMANGQQIPCGWWEKHNNNSFILPFTKTSTLQRTIKRSNDSCIKDGFIYSCHAERMDMYIPDRFELNEENGKFIGLFIAKGNAYKSNVIITNKDENIKSFVKQWFDKHNITWREVNTNSIIGKSLILSRFLTKLVGHNAKNKYIPVETFISSEPFIIGVLNGYYSGNSSMSHNSIDTGSASKRLIENISLLCSRLGIFGNVFKSQLKPTPTYRFSIRSSWGKIFSEKVDLLDDTKNRKLKSIVWTTTLNHIKNHNNVVLDPIIEINIIGTEKHPKVYDLTIPDTFNFGLANGLQVRDTSTTGYIQRRLVKGLEDAKVFYDHTVRSNKGKIIQFRYGEDSIDTIKVETQTFPLVTMSIQEIYIHYNFPDIEDKTATKTLSAIFIKQAMSDYKKQTTKMMEKCKEYTQRAIKYRDDIIKYVYGYRNESSVNCPVAFSFIIGNIQGQANINQYSLVDITPIEVFEMIENTMSDLEKLVTAIPTDLFKSLYYFYLSPKDLLLVKRFNRAAMVCLLDTIKLSYMQAIVAPGEMVGPVAAQSIGEISTQMTLNSFTYETPVVIRNRAGKVFEVQIGKFTNEFIEKATKKEYYKENDTTYAELDDYYEVPSCAENGEISWERIEAVTRHPVINEDGSNTMLHVTTDEEREVVATRAKSFLKLVDGKVIGVNGSDLKVGDYIPVSNMPLTYTEEHELDLREILPPTEYTYSRDLEKAYQLCAIARESPIGTANRAWWKNGNGSLFQLPYKNSDSVTSQMLKLERNQAAPLAPNCIYMSKLRLRNDGEQPSCIPEKIPLDYNFGYLVGAYAAEGCMTKYQLSISNNDIEYYNPILELCQKWNLTTKQYRNENKIQAGWTSADLRIYNTVICRILEQLCGKLSHNKFVSDKIIYSNRQCVLGFLDAYISGDGSISAKSKSISAGSVSKSLLEATQKMLNTLGVYGYIKKVFKQTSNNRGTLPENIHQPYMLFVTNEQAKTLAAMLNPTIGYKRENIKAILQYKYRHIIGNKHETIPNEIDGVIVHQPRPKNEFTQLLFNRIKSITEVQNTTAYAYDLTVATTRNFNLSNGLAGRDTFHNIGILSKTNATRGVPRIEEILSLSEKIKSPSLTVYLKPEDRTRKDVAQEIMYKLEHTTLGELVKETAIFFDPDDLNTVIEEDRALLAQYREFETMVNECAVVNLANTNSTKSKWLLRIEMDPESMLEKNITMDDIHFTLNNVYKDQITCVFSDYNADKLVFRIRMNEVIKQNGGKTAVNKKPLNQLDRVYLLKNFQDNLMQNVVIRGVKNIGKVSMRKVKNMLVEQNGAYVVQDQWVLDTVGTNLIDILAINYIDKYNTISNDIVEIYNVLGMEAASQAIYNEFVDVIKFDGTYVNYHHFRLLCDRMCYGNELISISRHGINNDDIGPIAKASFEETPEMFLNAAKHGELDIMTGVSANVMCGQEGLYGTNAFKVMLDMEEMNKITATEEYKVINRQKEIEEMFKAEELAVKSDMCSVKNLTVQNNVINISSVDMGTQNEDYNPF